MTVTTAFQDPTELLAQVDVAVGAVPGSYDVHVINPTGDVATLTGGFSITAAPQVSGTDRQGVAGLWENVPAQVVRVTGVGFLPPTASPPDILVTFGSPDLETVGVEYVSDTELLVTVNVAAGAALGDYAVTMVNPDGGTSIPGPGAFVSVGAPPSDAVVPHELRRHLGRIADAVEQQRSPLKRQLHRGEYIPHSGAGAGRGARGPGRGAATELWRAQRRCSPRPRRPLLRSGPTPARTA